MSARNPDVVVQDHEAASREAAGLLARAARERDGEFRLAVSGGSTPLRLFDLLAVFLVTGAGKAEMVARVLGGDEALPAARVRAARTVWVLDRGAAARLEP